MDTEGRELIGQILLRSGAITEVGLKHAIEEQEKTGERLGQTLIRLGYATERDVLTALGLQLDIDYIKLSEVTIDRSVIPKIPVNFAKRHTLIPISEKDGSLTVAVADPLNGEALDDMRLLLGKDVETVIASRKDIQEAIKKYYGVGAETMQEIAQDRDSTVEIVEAAEEEDWEEMATDA